MGAATVVEMNQRSVIMNNQVCVNNLTHEVTLQAEIVGYRGWLFRLQIAKVLIRLACLIAGLNVEFV